MRGSSKSTKESKGITNDQFYTNQNLAIDLCEFVKAQDWFKSVDRIIEPSAGSGSFSDQFISCLAYDIEPRNPNVISADFLSLNIEVGPATLVIGNPPFGRQSTLALQFIRRCCEFADYIAFILPKSFLKVSMQNKVPLTHSLLYERILDDNSFSLQSGESYKVPCVFQIWHKKPRIKTQLPKTSKYFNWTTKENGQLAIRRVGFYAGKAFDGENYNKTSEESHYYINSLIDPDIIKYEFNLIDWSVVSSKTTGPRSLSKSEIVYTFENHLNALGR